MTQAIRNYLHYCQSLLLEPVTFFRQGFNEIDLSKALALGLLSSWLSVLFLFFFQSLSLTLITTFFSDWIGSYLTVDELFSNSADRGKAFLFAGGKVLLHPFFVLPWLFFNSITLYIFAKVFIPSHEKMSQKHCLKILSCAIVGSWLSVVPVLGGMLAYVATVALAVIAIREQFATSSSRALLVVFVPQILLFLFLLFLLFIFSLIAITFMEATSGYGPIYEYLFQ